MINPDREALARAIDELVAGYTINTAGTVAVSATQYWEDMDTCPRGVKVQLLGKGGVATYGLWDGKNTFWTHWAPVPRRRE